MFKQLTTFVFLYLLTTVQLGHSSAFSALFDEKYHPQVYDKLNDYLVSNVHTCDAETNIEAALEWLKLKAHRFCFLTNQYKIVRKQLKALQTLDEETRWCNSSGNAVIEMNNKATRGNGFKPSSELQQARRIDKVLNVYFVRHARECEQVYESNFREKHGKLDKNLIEEVETLARGYIKGLRDNKNTYLSWSSSNSLADLRQELEKDSKEVGLKDMLKVSPYLPVISNVLRGALKYLARGDLESEYLSPIHDELRGGVIIFEQPIERLFNEHLLKPCQYYLSELGHGILDLAVYDSQLLEDKFDDEKKVLDSLDYYVSQVSYQLCHHIDSKRKDVLKDIKKQIHQSGVLEDNGVHSLYHSTV